MLVGRLDAEPVEAVGQADVGVQSRDVLVEVQERLRATMEHAALALDQSGHPAQLLEERLELVQRVRSPRVARHHRTTPRGATRPAPIRHPDPTLVRSLHPAGSLPSARVTDGR